MLRLIEQFGVFLRRLLRLKEEKEIVRADEEIAEAMRDLFGVDPRFFPFLTAESLASALGNAERMDLFARLLAEQAEVAGLRGDPFRAQGAAQRGLELLDRIGVTGDRTALAARLRSFLPP